MRTIIAAGVVAAVIAATSATAATFITSANIKDGTIQTVDISAKAKRALKGNRGPQGPAGQDGFDGSPGPQGPAGIQRLRLISNSVSVPPGTTSPALAATCASGETAISGGFIFPGLVIGSSPAGQSWLVKGFNDLNVPLELQVYAYCSGGIERAATGALPSDSLRATTATVSRSR